VITPPTIKSKPEDPTPTATETKATVTLVDLIRKAQYLQDILSGRYTTNILNNYTAVYTFYGQNEFGKSVTFIVQTDFQIGSFDYCGITEPPQ
jgi:hypothetical protein